MDKTELARTLLSYMQPSQGQAQGPMDSIRMLVQAILSQQQGQQQPQAIGTNKDGSILYDTPQANNFQAPKDLLSLVTQRFGQKSGYDMFSGGVNYGVDFAVPTGTPVKLPEGRWKIVDATNGVRSGGIGNSSNRGYGNSVYAQNVDTGEKIRLSHLSNTNAQAGQELQGGQQVGLSGRTGNASGPHLDVEYYNKAGQKGDVLRTPYAQQLFNRKG